MSQPDLQSEPQTLYAQSALVQDGGACQWWQNVAITIDGAGVIVDLQQDQAFPAGQTVYGPLLPGMANVHSHAFQRAMAGTAEYRAVGQNSFWSWREAMYGLAAKLTPEKLAPIARQLYVEMLKAGYTAVGEFHYLHNADRGQAVDMGAAVLGAAQSVGLPMTVLPVLYQTSDFGGAEPNDGQKPFVHGLDDYTQLIKDLTPLLGRQDQMGMALHSLRAVPEDVLLEAVKRRPDGPIHIHIAEQMKEVEASITHSGQRPVAWLLDRADVDKRWTLVHATHLDDSEVIALAKSGAVAGLCPTTEANLGDGFFRAKEFISAGGTVAIGSDSHISIDVREELRWLEYGERLNRQQRTVLAGPRSRSPMNAHNGAALYAACARGGAQSVGQNMGAIEVGKRADIVALDSGAASLVGAKGMQVLDRFVFAGQPNPVRHVMIAGQWAIIDGHHAQEDVILKDYTQTLNSLAETADD